jgi:hypothetical protein
MATHGMSFRLLPCAAAFLLWAHAASAASTPTPDPTQTPSPAIPGTESETAENRPASAFAAGGSFSFASRYLFQGIDYSDSKPVLNPQADLTAGPFQARLWMNHDLDQNVSNEFDLSLFHEWSAKKFSFTTGYTYLWYPHREGWDPSQEFYVEASHDGPLSPTLSVHYDFDAGMGSYSTFGVSHSIARRVGTVSFGANLFYQDHYYGLSGFPSSEWNIHLERSLKKITVTPSISRFLTWKNGDFREENVVKSAWLFSFQIAREF